MKMPYVSVIIPTLNEEKYIERILNSLMEQDYGKKFEVIVADSYSEDRTADIAKRYGAEVALVKKRSVGAGRNGGARIAKGDIFLFTDADTILAKNYLSVMEKELYEENVVGATSFIYVSKFGLREKFGIIPFNEILIRRFTRMIGNNMTVKRDAFTQIGGFNDNLTGIEDIEFAQRLKKVGEIKFVRGTYVITSTRRYDKWGALKLANAWPLGYMKYRITKKSVKFEPVR